MKVAYNAIDEDEISVCVGDVVDVISKVSEDEGWWKVNTTVIRVGWGRGGGAGTEEKFPPKNLTSIKLNIIISQ